MNWNIESGIPYPNWYEQKARLKKHFWFNNLPSQSAQELLKQLHEGWKSFYKLKQTGGIENPNPPKFKHSNFNIRFLNKGFRIDNNKLILTIPKQLKKYLKEKYNINEKFLIIYLPKKITGNPKIIEIIPLDGIYKVNIIVELSDVNIKEDNNIYMSIDFGIYNLMTCYISTGKTFIISGRQILSINRYFDKKISYYQSIANAQQVANGKHYCKNTKRIKKLYEKRKEQINHILHAASKIVIDIADKENVCIIIIGDIKDIRKNMNLGKTTNQKFHKWPFKKIKDKLTYKAEQKGIAIELQEESYTSQCSPYTKEVSKEFALKSNRKYRGLYKDGNKLFNSDCVGAYNILRKYLCRIGKTYSAVVGLDTPVMYRWNSQYFSENAKM